MLIIKILNNYYEYFSIFIRNTLNDRSYIVLMVLLSILFTTLLLVIYYKYITTFINKKHVLNNEFINIYKQIY